jgi:phage/plasmid primase-like uncharacterized protein
MEQRGLIAPREIHADGKIHRCDVRGKRGKGDGSYILFPEGKVPAGGFQNWKDGQGWENWSYDLGRRRLTPEEVREIQLKKVVAERERAEQDAKDIEPARQRAQQIWSRAREGSHPYLERKLIALNGARILHGALVVPARTIEGELRGLKFIPQDPKQKKRWMTGSRPRGAFHAIGGSGRDRIVIAEGFATAASIHAATGDVVLVAFDCGNLQPVAEAVREKYPHAKIIIAADDDWKTKGNPGFTKAMDAAVAVDGLVAFPDNLAGDETDFNDLAIRSIDDVCRCMAKAGTPAEALERKLIANPVSAFEPENIKKIAALRARDRAAFEGLRENLKRAGVRVAELDKLLGIEADKPENKVDTKQVDILVELTAAAQLFHTPDKQAYADLTIKGHRETRLVEDRGFKLWLRHRFYERTNSSPSSETLNTALGTIEAKAIFSGEEREVHLRIAGHGGNIYLDLGDLDWRAVEITPLGWQIISDPPVRFRRSATMLPIPIPARGGSISNLRPFLNVPDDDAFVLAVAFLVAALRPDGPYPVLSLHGPAGTAKSTFSEVMRRLVDFGKPALRTLPREKDDFFIVANNNHVVVFENISFIHPWLADLMCSLSTGGGFSKRELYTNMGETVFDVQRPQILNGIEDFVIRGDLADRALPLTLNPIPNDARRDEKGFWREFQTAAPLILSSLLDAVANGLRHLPNTKLPALPRMADFAVWATACEKGAPWADTTFAKAYAQNRATATHAVLEDDTVAQALQKVMATRTEYRGTATELLTLLTNTWDSHVPEKWPKGANRLTGRLRRILPQLALIGIWIKFPRDEHARMVVVTKGGIQEDIPAIQEDIPLTQSRVYDPMTTEEF